MTITVNPAHPATYDAAFAAAVAQDRAFIAAKQALTDAAVATTDHALTVAMVHHTAAIVRELLTQHAAGLDRHDQMTPAAFAVGVAPTLAEHDLIEMWIAD